MSAATRVASIVHVSDYEAWAFLVYEHGKAESGVWNPRTKHGIVSYRTKTEAEEARREL